MKNVLTYNRISLIERLANVFSDMHFDGQPSWNKLHTYNLRNKIRECGH